MTSSIVGSNILWVWQCLLQTRFLHLLLDPAPLFHSTSPTVSDWTTSIRPMCWPGSEGNLEQEFRGIHFVNFHISQAGKQLGNETPEMSILQLITTGKKDIASRWFHGKESACWCRRWDEKIPWRRKWQPTPVFLLEEPHGQRSLVGYSPWGSKRVGHDFKQQ